MNVCNYCGVELDVEMNYCPLCGHKSNTPATSASDIKECIEKESNGTKDESYNFDELTQLQKKKIIWCLWFEGFM